jgi:hypothetical protein
MVAGSDDDDDSYLDRIQHLDIRINKLDVDIVKHRPVGGEVLSPEFFKAGASAAPEIINRSKPFAEVDSKTFMAEFQREAGTQRNEK